jgi:hypothetical protein
MERGADNLSIGPTKETWELQQKWIGWIKITIAMKALYTTTFIA